MAYVAVAGGQEAIKESNELLEYSRVKARSEIDLQSIKNNFGDLISQVMSEASLYDEDLAALAIKQARGSMEEAVFLLRAHRSTLPRIYYSTITEPSEMEVRRRISSSFKDIPGGQFLGKAYDFNQRFLNFDLANESKEDLGKIAKAYEDKEILEKGEDLSRLPKVVDYIEKIGLIERAPKNDAEPDDITKKSISFPSTRSQRLQSLTRGQTGAVTSLGYAEIRGFGVGSHPNIGELRVGDMSICVNIDGDEEDDYYIGQIEVTEVESFISASIKKGKGYIKGFEIGYGLCFGQNESKAIAMSVLDHSLESASEDSTSPTADDEFVLLDIDSVESSGFISHLKLPHYVTFQSALDGMRKIKEEIDEE
ncbi:MAG: carbon-phosphorus lyase complex subunit PhnI [Finegoldia sp.]|nr:carbon-phosphorus lyase complex subunit PhnI [Finegoldia sp.]